MDGSNNELQFTILAKNLFMHEYYKLLFMVPQGAPNHTSSYEKLEQFLER